MHAKQLIESNLFVCQAIHLYVKQFICMSSNSFVYKSIHLYAKQFFYIYQTIYLYEYQFISLVYKTID
jgi:hypothetical protein